MAKDDIDIHNNADAPASKAKHERLERLVQERTKSLREENQELRLAISELQKTNQQWAESEYKFQVLFEHSNDALVIYSDNEFINCNDAALQLFGYTRDEVLGIHPAEFPPSNQANAENTRLWSKELIETAKRDGKACFQWTLLRKDGGSFPADVVITPFNCMDKPVFLATVRDISNR